MPKHLPSQKYFRTVNDLSIPTEIGSNKNIILTANGIRVIAQHYKEKYAIDMVAFSASMKTAPQMLISLINEKKQTITQEFYRCGFIFIDCEAGQDGHGMPIIWEKKEDKDNLFFLDSSQYLGRIYDERKCDLIACSLFSPKTDLATLPGKSPTAYVISDEDVFYIDRENNKLDNLSSSFSLFGGRDNSMYSSIKRMQRQLGLSEENFIQVSDEALSSIRSITEHDVNYSSRGPKEFRDELLKLNPNIVMWSHVGSRQVDNSSCITDALIIVKDGLRLENTLEVEAREKYIKKERDVNYFYMPEPLLKSAQISSFAGKQSNANPDKKIHTHYEKNGRGKRTEKSHFVSLQKFRNKYETPVHRGNKITKFGFYTLHKGKKFAQIIEKKWAENQKKEMQTTLAELAGVYEDFIQHHNHENLAKNYYLTVINKGCGEESQQMLVTILDYLSMIFDEPTHFHPELIKQADSVKELLIALSLDKNYSNIHENLNSLANSRIAWRDLLIALAGELSNEINEIKSLSLEVVHQRLNGALTIAELQMLPYVKLIRLPEDKRKVLIENIQNNRPNKEDPNCFFYSTNNEFLDCLVKMLSKGASLTQFANLCSHDQSGFIAVYSNIILFMKNGISFAQLAQLHIDDLTDIIEWTNSYNRNLLLCEPVGSPGKATLVNQINLLIDKKILTNNQRINFNLK